MKKFIMTINPGPQTDFKKFKLWENNDARQVATITE